MKQRTILLVLAFALIAVPACDATQFLGASPSPTPALPQKPPFAIGEALSRRWRAHRDDRVRVESRGGDATGWQSWFAR
jgi:hypothetical protein